MADKSVTGSSGVPTRIAFLDRDGTINASAAEGQYITDPDALILIPGAAQAIRSLNDSGIKVAVVTNQRGVALGQMTEQDLARVHERLRELLQDAAGAVIDVIVHCPHDIGECHCRKPHTGMLDAVVDALGPVSVAGSVMIGDRISDIQAGRAFGVGTVLLGTDADDLYAAVNRMLSSSSPRGDSDAVRLQTDVV